VGKLDRFKDVVVLDPEVLADQESGLSRLLGDSDHACLVERNVLLAVSSNVGLVLNSLNHSVQTLELSLKTFTVDDGLESSLHISLVLLLSIKALVKVLETFVNEESVEEAERELMGELTIVAKLLKEGQFVTVLVLMAVAIVVVMLVGPVVGAAPMGRAVSVVSVASVPAAHVTVTVIAEVTEVRITVTVIVVAKLLAAVMLAVLLVAALVLKLGKLVLDVGPPGEVNVKAHFHVHAIIVHHVVLGRVRTVLVEVFHVLVVVTMAE